MFFTFSSESGRVKFHTEKLGLPEPWTYEIDRTQDGNPSLIVYCPPHQRCTGPTFLNSRKYRPTWKDFWQEAVADVPDMGLLSRWRKLMHPDDRASVGQTFNDAKKSVESLPERLRKASRFSSFDLVVWEKSMELGVHFTMFANYRLQITWDRQSKISVFEEQWKKAA